MPLSVAEIGIFTVVILIPLRTDHSTRTLEIFSKVFLEEYCATLPAPSSLWGGTHLAGPCGP